MPAKKTSGLAGDQKFVDLFAAANETTTDDTVVIDPLPPAPDPDEIVSTPPTPPPVPLRPAPESELTPDQRRIRDLEDRLAKEMGKKDPDIVFQPADATGDNILLHFLEDGFTTLGKVWYRGQELEFTRGSAAFLDTFDRNGRTWLDLVDNEFAQVEKYGKVMFRRGPWPGKTLVDGKPVFEKLSSLTGNGSVSGVSDQELQAAQAAERKRGRAAPRLSA